MFNVIKIENVEVSLIENLKVKVKMLLTKPSINFKNFNVIKTHIA